MTEDDVEEGRLSPRFETARTAAFSDCVIAIAATLLVLDLDPDQLHTHDSLAAALFAQWPRYIALVSSFAVISLIWIHHHRIFRLIEHADNHLLNINLVLMLVVVIVPYPTALLAEFPDEDAAALFYTAVVAVISILFNVLWSHAKHHLRPDLDPAYIRSIGLQFRIAAITYVVLFAISPFSVKISIVGNIVAAMIFAVPPHAIRLRLSRGRSVSSTATR
jgi:uncharacterized membrane protein